MKLDRTIIIYPSIYRGKNTLDLRTSQDHLDEITALAQAISLEIISSEIITIRNIRPSHIIGKGKTKELADIVQSEAIDLLIVDTSLSPVQQRNLENDLKCKVIDRTALILEIFGERASTKEGELQVSLAHQIYQKSRLVRSWTHLERQRGGSGFMGGPGERQIESDRRIIDENIVKIKKQLDIVKKTRTLHRKSRKRIPYPVVALVGYTNAGKSTLFNHLTGADVYAQDALFVTLDPTMREVILPSRRKIILSDTVGFISNLPTELIAAFRATLEEVIEADLILHVRDIHSQDTKAQKLDVINILEGLVPAQKIDESLYEVLNKVDLLESDAIERLKNKQTPSVRVSAITGKGIDHLLEVIDDFFNQKDIAINVKLLPSQGKILSWIHNNGENVEITQDDENILVKATLTKKNAAIFENKYQSQII